MTEIVRYGILDNETGYMKGLFMSENEAITNLNYLKSCTIVKLVGQMPEPKKPRLMAPAMMLVCRQVSVSSTLFSSEKEARDTLRDIFLSWPAIPNKDGMYEVPL